MNIAILANVFIPIIIVALLVVAYVRYKTFSARGRATSATIDKNSKKPMSSSESIGSISGRLGEDVRDVWMLGYSNDQINDVLTGKYTLSEMYKMEPAGNTMAPKGKEILAQKRQVK
jgi:hypothetical protein